MRDLSSSGLSRFASCVLLALALLCISTAALHAQGKSETPPETGAATVPTGDQPPPERDQIQPIRTASPRETFGSFLWLRRELQDAYLAYRAVRSRANAKRLELFETLLVQLLDLSSVPAAARERGGLETGYLLLDIFGRVDLPPLESIPEADAFSEDDKPARWQVPGTPIRIVRIEEGSREGEFLFGSRTPVVAPVFFQRVRRQPLRFQSKLGFDSWSTAYHQLTGPMIPISVGAISAMPEMLQKTWLGTPVWKVLLVLVLYLLAAGAILSLHRLINRRETKSEIGRLWRLALTPLAVMGVLAILGRLVEHQLFISGTFSVAVFVPSTIVFFLAAAWLFWLLIAAIAERIILSPRISDKSLDAGLLRLVAGLIGLVGGALIVTFGMQVLGLPALSVLAGLGIGGLAVALAIRPTLENLIGGVILYLDRPLRVGDYCTIGDHTGTVESIGVRSTQIRRLDRTLVSVPNAALADKEIVNWARCDQMLILTTLGLRYETEPDQLRYVLVKLREMFHAHPRIDPETVRVRFTGYGESSLDIQIRVYALTREWNDFFAIREDVLLRASDIVRDSGTGFAFPSQTLYMGRDDGLDDERGAAAVNKVEAWRKSNTLPFPKLPAARIEQLEDTLDYPPRGSPEAGLVGPQAPEEVPETLSAQEPPGRAG